MSMHLYRLSSYVRMTRLDNGNVFAGHPFFANYVLTGGVARVLMAVSERLSSAEQLHAQLLLPLPAIEKALAFLNAEHFLLKNDEDEEAQIREHVRRLSTMNRERNEGIFKDVVHIGKRFRDYAPLELQAAAAKDQSTPPSKVNFLIVGGCLTQLAADALLRIAPGFGIEPATEEAFPFLLDSVLMEKPDVVVFQPSTAVFLEPLWGQGAFLTDEERVSRLQALKDELSLSLAKVRARAAGSLLLVHGFVTPVYSPLGRAEFRSACHFYRIVYELNQVIIEAIHADPNAMLIDEERWLSAHGKVRLMDHAVSTFSHHGPVDLIPSRDPHGAERAATLGVTQACHAPRLFAQAYLESYVMWKGIGRIKCIVLDLDNTLWPGLAAESDFTLDAETFSWGTLAGIHQALKVAQRRGVLLAICSRNHEDDVIKAWRQMQALGTSIGSRYLLQPDDFVVQKINWQTKSANIAEIMDALGVSPDQVLFIDDSAIERAEVQAAYPAIRVLGDNMNLVRAALLDDPFLQSNVVTAESASRTEMVKAQLQRDAVKNEVHDELAFLRKLSIRLQVIRLRGPARLARVVELIQRTNQFNTTLLRLGADEVSRCIQGSAGAVYVLEASDRFTHYGLVGVCVVSGNEIVALVMSCRIIPLRAEVPFLAAALTDYGRAPLAARIVEGPRNQPCRHVYRAAGFDESAPGEYVLPQLSLLPPVDFEIYGMEHLDEADAAREVATAAVR